MPYNYDPNLDDEESQDQQSQDAPLLAGGSQVIGGASQTQGAPTGGASSKGGNQYQNLQAYLDANSGSDFGQKFTGKVQSDVAGAEGAQQQAATNFRTASDQATIKQDKDLVDNSLANPTQADVTGFKRQKDAEYRGPMSFSDLQADYQKAYGATRKAQDVAGAAQTEGGRFALLGNYFGNPAYTQGQKSLDNLLVSQDDGAKQGIAQAKANADQAAVNFRAQEAPLSDYAASNKAETERARDYARTQGTQKLGDVSKTYDALLKQRQAEYEAELAKVQQGLAMGPAQYQSLLSKYGLTTGPAEDFTKSQNNPYPALIQENGADTGYWGVNPAAGGYLENGVAPTSSNVLSGDQQSTMRALQGLMDQPLTEYDADSAGKFDPNAMLKFNGEAYGNTMASRQKDYEAQEKILGQNISNVYSNLTRGLPGASKEQLQAQFDQLNLVRAQYGLAPVKNPFFDGVSGKTGTL